MPSASRRVVGCSTWDPATGSRFACSPSAGTKPSASSAGRAVIGDAETPPFRDGAVDGVILECVLSLLPDKRRALQHARRVLRLGGRVAISDVTVERPLPFSLEEVASWSACVGGALSTDAYIELLHDAGFSDIEEIGLDEELVALVEQARRRFGLIELALRTKGIDIASVGLDRERVESFRSLATIALDFIRDGGAGYRLFHATKR